ncbi:RING finger protein B [Nymphaea thermarum]|nr:RING finger protein B [Nymphaea thermarum]
MRAWYGVAKSAQAVAAHGMLLAFTILLVMKLDSSRAYSWWFVFTPLWLFHSVVARGRFSLPAPSPPRNRHWAPCHAIVATPLIVSFELLLCVFLESLWARGFPAVNLKIVFLPLLVFEVIILIDNFRMCMALLPGDEESINNEVIQEMLPHFWVAMSMVFFVVATVFMLLKLSELFAFLICTKWSNPAIYQQNHCTGPSSSSQTTRQLDWTSGFVVSSEEDENEHHMCGTQDVGGHVMKISLIAFEVFLCMHLEGTPQSARNIPLSAIFLPLFLLQGVGVLFAVSKLVEKVVLLLSSRSNSGRCFSICSRAHDCFSFLHHGSRLLGWWSIDESSREEHARPLHSACSGYSTFSDYPPEVVKKMPKRDLAEEVWRLQAALGEQAEITKYSQREYVRLQNEKVLCRICFEAEIGVVLLPCRHRILCSTCCKKCKYCPLCRVSIEERMPVYDV